MAVAVLQVTAGSALVKVLSKFGPVTASFDIIERHDGGTLVLALSGELDMATVSVLSARLEEAVSTGGSVLVDLSDLQFIDSTGLRALLRASADAKRDGWRLAITRPSPRVGRVFDVAGVADLLPFVGT